MPFFALGIALLISACSTLAPVKPQTPREALVAAEIAFQGTLVSTQRIAEQGLLSVNEAEVLRDAFINIQGTLDVARLAIAGGDASEADRNIRIANTLLRAIALELDRINNTRDPPPPKPEGTSA